MLPDPGLSVAPDAAAADAVVQKSSTLAACKTGEEDENSRKLINTNFAFLPLSSRVVHLSFQLRALFVESYIKQIPAALMLYPEF